MQKRKKKLIAPRLQLRMIASSRKKTDRRDAYWIARALQSGM